jgi:hypothetical protein
LRLRLGRPEGRREEKRERQPKRPAHSFSPDRSHRGFSSMLANTANDLSTRETSAVESAGRVRHSTRATN